MSIHRTAAEGFGRAAAAYERGRPGYPQAAIDWMVDQLDITSASTVVDLGAGTGKFSRMLRPTGARVIAIEPVAAMRVELARVVPGIEVLDGTAEAIPCGDASADAVTAAQAFHWFSGAAALREIHRVLRPQGGLGLIWNRRDKRDPLQAAIDAIIRPHRGRAPIHERDSWRESMMASALFRPTGERQFSYEQAVDADGLVARVLSISFIATLSDGERSTVRDQVSALVDRTPIMLPYLTDVFLFRRR
ncbi:MAG: class I SAM-dependent methyltransferase [Chloroflexi bacterium]|nr:MAG: class I SAM-dependent methyltransferase [Chloroflexota bacterium]